MTVRPTHGWPCVLSVAILLMGACGGGGAGVVTAPPSSNVGSDPNVVPRPDLTKIRIGIGAPNEPVQFSPKLAQMLGYFEKLGLSADITGFEGDGKAV